MEIRKKPDFCETGIKAVLVKASGEVSWEELDNIIVIDKEYRQ